MKIMQINAVYPTGSTGKIVKDIHTDLVNKGYESIVCYGRGDAVDENNVYKIAPEPIIKMQSLQSKLTGYAYSGCLYSTYNLIKIIKKEKPDIVHLHCINSYMVNIYKLIQFLKTNNIRTVITLHAEFMYTAGCAHALNCDKWKTGCGNCPQRPLGRPSSKFFDRSAEEWSMMNDAFKGFENVVITSVSNWLHDRAKQSPFFLNKKMEVVLNGIDTKVFQPTDSIQLKKKYKIREEKIVLHVTPNFSSPIKGGKYVLQLAKLMKNENIRFFIVGFNGDKSNLPPNVTALERTKNQKELAMFYSMADITLLTSVKETFSMVCAESLSCGTPVVGFEAGGPESISLKEYSEFVKNGDINSLEKAVTKWLNVKSSLISEDLSKKANQLYSSKTMSEEYIKIYKHLHATKELNCSF
ncbi:glycosyltransferase [Peribacillus frigoritolerans]|uniref:glycosyltransferase n=1 Tax=Peribacillus frigoritolerans TaxID=450367 RepID=UPI0025701463|nr:glycosyltransferase [Peribacillus frigoritolerans]WJE46139.1 glycosyltransferase [Peribacillus frigoritolerans]